MAQHQHEATSGALGRMAFWRKSSYSGNDGNCVEVAPGLPDAVAVRDSKDPSGPALVFARDEWAAFLARMRTEEHSRF